MHRVFSYSPSKPRSTLMRLLFGLMGLLLLVFLLVFGVFIGAAMLLFAATRRLLAARRPAPIAAKADNVIDAEFHVINKAQPSLKAQ
jgi:uncharacterized protein (DUF58 family)